MTKRPLAFVCLIFLIIQGIILIIRGGLSSVEMPASSIFYKPEGQEVCVTGEVYNKKTTSNNQIIFLKNNSISNQEKIIIYDSNFTNISIGQIIQVKGKIGQFDRAHNPGNFDQILYYAKENIYGAIFSENIIEITEDESSFKEYLYQLKCAWKNMLVECMGEEQGTVLSAMLLGEKSEMDGEIKELYQKSGIGHVLAISGLHISFIGLGIYQSLRKIGLPFVVAGTVAIGGLSVYTCMIGFSISVFRAYTMLLLKIIADMTGEVYDMITALMVSATLSVWKQPLCLVDAGFYLSYGAVLGLFLLMPYLMKSFLGKRKWTVIFIPGLSINIALLPIQLWYYNEFPTYSILINLFVIPMMSVVLTLGMVSPICGQMSLYFCKWILIFYEGVSELALSLPFSRIVTGRPLIWKVILYYIVVGLLVCHLIKKRYLIIISYILSIFLLVFSPVKNVQITMLDVGQGDGLFVRGPEGGTYFIDGGSSDVKEVGKYRLEPFLKYEGVGCLDYVFISHGDIDHYSGIMEMLSRQKLGIRIRNLILPVNYKEDAELLKLATMAKENNTEVMVIAEGTVLREGNMNIICVQPSAKDKLTGNQGSMVLEISYNQFEMLCTGDVEEMGEKLLEDKVRGKEYEILKVSHHGSKYSTKEEFLDAISVKVAMISAGKENRYGHPHKETLDRLEQEKCKIYQTVENGAITIRTDGKKMSLEVFH